MSVFSSPGAAYRAVPAAGCGAESRGLVRAGRAAGAAFLLAVLGGLSLAAGAAQANTFPGTNGVLGYSSQIGTNSSGSKYEIVSKSTSGSGGTEYRCTVNEKTDVQPKFSEDGKMIAWLQDGNVWTMSLSEGPSGVWQCPYEMPPPGNARAGITPDTPTQVTFDSLDSWLGGWTQWEYPAGTADSSHVDRKAWLFFSRRTGSPLNFEVFKVQVDKDGAPVANTLENVTNYAVNPGPPAGTVGITDSQPTVCTKGTTRKLAWTSNRAGSTVPSGSTATPKTDVWEQALDANYDLTGSPTNRAENTVNEEGAAAYKPTVSDDCATIAFQTDRDTGLLGLGSRNLEIYRTDGVGVKRLSYNDATLPASAGLTDVTGYDVTPQWSPDATRICFHSGRAREPAQWMLTAGLLVLGQWEVYTLDAVNGEGTSGSGTVRETRREFNDERCGWQETPTP